MELKAYLQILMKMWWVIVLIFFITLLATFIFTRNQPELYESSATFVVRPLASSTVERNELATMIDTLSRRVEINTTYAEIAKSNLIRKGAIERLNLQRGSLVALMFSAVYSQAPIFLRSLCKGMTQS